MADNNSTPTLQINNTIQAVVISVMVACIAIAIVQFGRAIDAAWNGTYMVIIAIIAALTGNFSYQLAHRRYLSGGELLKFQGIELLTLLILSKIASYLDNNISEIMSEIRIWPQDPSSFFSGETLVVFALILLSWFTAWHVANDMEELKDPTLYTVREIVRPLERLQNKFLVGGVLLLFFSGATRIDYITQSGNTPSNLSGLALNTLIYFVGGLFVFAQLRLARLSRIWEIQKTHIAPALKMRWIQYSLILLGIVLVIAFLLPTGYTISFMQLITLIGNIISQIISLLFFLIVFPIVYLLSLIRGTPADMPPVNMSQTQPVAMPTNEASGNVTLPIVEILRSAAFWVIALGALWYIMHSYLKDRPELWEAIQRLRPIKFLRTLFDTLRRTLHRWWRGVRQEVNLRIMHINEYLRERHSNDRRKKYSQQSGETYREHLFYHYLKTLELAEDCGYPRQKAETPYEYEEHLSPQVVDAQNALDQLTHNFIEARYSTHAVNQTMLEDAQNAAEEIQTLLRNKQKEQNLATTHKKT